MVKVAGLRHAVWYWRRVDAIVRTEKEVSEQDPFPGGQSGSCGGGPVRRGRGRALCLAEQGFQRPHGGGQSGRSYTSALQGPVPKSWPLSETPAGSGGRLVGGGLEPKPQVVTVWELKINMTWLYSYW